MKKLLCAFSVLLTLNFCFAQVPQSFKYQAVVRGNNGNVLVNQLVSFQLTILKDNPNGAVVYSERQNLSTNSYGIVNINVGTGTILNGDFTTIAWGNFSHFIKVEFDAAGGNNFQFMGTSQILSVPYALYAESAGSAANDNDTNPTNELQAIGLSNDTLYLSNGGHVFLGDYLDNTDGQTLTLAGGNTLSISGGNSIVLSQGLADADADPTNELQNLSLNNNTLSISGGNSLTLPPDGDSSPTNEIQTLSLIGTNLSISGGNTVALPPDGDSNSTNELQTLSYTNGAISISSGNTINIPSTGVFFMPHGFSGTPVLDSASYAAPYTVPAGKTLYVTWNNNGFFLGDPLENDSTWFVPVVSAINGGAFPMIPENTKIFQNINPLNKVIFNGILVDNTPEITPLLIRLYTGDSYTVPVGKNLYIMYIENTYTHLKVNGIKVFNSGPLPTPIILPSGTLLQFDLANARSFIRGYLK